MDRIGALAHALTARRDPEKAAAMAAYMKDQFPFLGVASPERRTAQREALGDWRAPTEDELSDFARACWAKGVPVRRL